MKELYSKLKIYFVSLKNKIGICLIQTTLIRSGRIFIFHYRSYFSIQIVNGNILGKPLTFDLTTSQHFLAQWKISILCKLDFSLVQQLVIFIWLGGEYLLLSDELANNRVQTILLPTKSLHMFPILRPNLTNNLCDITTSLCFVFNAN